MRVLIVEDEQYVVDELCESMARLTPSVETVIARSRSSGIDELHGREFDFIICDLRLPTHDGGVDTEEEHGLAVHSVVRSVCPGTPCLFFTGYGTSEAILEQLSSGETHDILGTGCRYSMTRLLEKDRLTSCVNRVDNFNSGLESLDAVRIDLLDSRCSLQQNEKRALRLLARSFGGTRIEARALGGLSGAQTLRVSVKDDQGLLRASYFVKIDLRSELEEERENFRQYISPYLGFRRFPSLEMEIRAGIGKREALCYQLATEHTESFFDVLAESERDALAVIGELRETFGPWLALGKKKVVRIGDLRAARIADSEFYPYRNVLGSTENFENARREMTFSCQHGDLHGFNILCSPSNEVAIIDFGNVGLAPTCIDPIILELSVLFHKESPFRCNSWPTYEQAESWFDLEDYLNGCPFPSFIKKCREWASEIGGSAELPPVVYAETVRQLKYEDTNRERALGIARAAMRNATSLTSSD